MGKWCHVDCACPNRRPLDPDDDWGAYACGHEEGALVRLWPGGFFEMARALQAVYGLEAARFAVFLKIGDGKSYRDEYMVLSADERDLWRLEVEQLQAYLSGEEYMPWPVARRWQEYWERESRELNALLVLGTPDEILRDALSLCDASVASGKPIEMWL